MTKEIYFISPGNKGVPCELDAVSYGSGRLIIYLNGRRQAVQIAARPEVLAAELRRLADLLEPSSVKQRHEKTVKRELAALPEMMTAPETAWPWLVQRFPWLFDGIDLRTEPYASYLKVPQVEKDLELLAAYRGRDLSQADVAGLLFGDRTKTGGSYRRRILAVMEALNPTTTTSSEGYDQDGYEELAA
ncbi:MAG: hypothetical protein KJ077_05845 [Anaerolineae bacterium]|nr:hypothetical protein [Anaerolineae bacterium]